MLQNSIISISKLQNSTFQPIYVFDLDGSIAASFWYVYLQKTTLYKNGLTNLIDVTQAFYTLNRAEIDRDIIYTNVWQSLLMKAAATGNFDLFINEF